MNLKIEKTVLKNACGKGGNSARLKSSSRSNTKKTNANNTSNAMAAYLYSDISALCLTLCAAGRYVGGMSAIVV